MNELRALQVDAFTDEPLSGNAAGIVPDAAGLSDEQRQAIARELAVSETAFLLPAEDADRRIRYFTPTTEVDLCGHATIASHAFLHEEGVISPGTHSLETNVGVLEIEVTDDGLVRMTQDEPSVREVDADPERIADALGIDPAAITEVDLPIAVASTGLDFLIVPVAFLESLGDAEPDMAAIETLSTEYEVTGLYPFTFDSLSAAATLHARMFAPAAGVPEDPVTGTASGAAAAYLRQYGAVEELDGMVFEQGAFLDRPGRVHVDAAEEIRVGGRAATAFDGQLSVPASDGDDEIIEL